MTYNEYIHKKILNPLKMIYTGFDKKNITQYYTLPKKSIKKFNKFEYNHLMLMGAAGGLKSSISDFIKFKNFNKLLNNNSIKLLQKMSYFCKYNKEDKTYIIYHTGKIFQNNSKLTINYDNNWKFKNINIMMATNINIF